MATITKRLVRSAKPRGKKYEISCSSLRGFILRVLPSGKKVYFARCRHDGRDTRQRIGLTSELSFEDARARAGLLLTRGTTTPTGRADSAPAPGDASPYLRDFTRRFLDGHVDIAVKASTARAYRLALKNHILPRFGGARLAAITREDVETWVGSFRRHPQAARTACMVLSCLFSKAAQWGADVMRYVEKTILLQTLDHLWREHLVNLDHLRSVIGFRGYAQRDPLQEYKSESFELFQAMLANLRQAVTAQMMRVELVQQAAQEPEPALPEMHEAHAEISPLAPNTEEQEWMTPGPDVGPSRAEIAAGTIERDPANPATWGKVGRNEPCPCGSGKKYKHCHGTYA